MFLDLSAPGWLSTSVPVAIGFRRRRRGLRPLTRGRSLLLAGRWVHTIGMKEALWLVGLADDGRVVHVRYVVPTRAVVLRGAAFVLELPPTRPPPRHGSILTPTRS